MGGSTIGTTRRGLITGMAGAAVIGWSATRRSWVTAAEAASPHDGGGGLAELPRLDGTV